MDTVVPSLVDVAIQADRPNPIWNHSGLTPAATVNRWNRLSRKHYGFAVASMVRSQLANMAREEPRALE